MSNAKLDENSRPTITCASKLDGVTIVPIVADPSTHRLQAFEGHTGVDNGNNDDNAMLDENSVPVWTALSSDDDGKVVEVYGDLTAGAILIDNT